MLVGRAQGLFEVAGRQPLAGQYLPGEALGFLQGVEAGVMPGLQAAAVEQHAVAFGKGERQAAQRLLERASIVIVVPWANWVAVAALLVAQTALNRRTPPGSIALRRGGGAFLLATRNPARDSIIFSCSQFGSGHG